MEWIIQGKSTKALHKNMRLLSILLALVLATGEPASRTLFRVTPRNYTGLTNMNSGDPAGVVFFGLFELALPIICAANPKQVNCQNTPILQIPNKTNDFRNLHEKQIPKEFRIQNH